MMSNNFFFPLFQFAILALLVYAVWRDYRPIVPSGITATVTRGSESMEILKRYTGLVIAAIITVVNKSVFDDKDSDWRHWSAFINLFDLCAVVYLCYVSPFGRNFIVGLDIRLREERR
jgi:hypothetical protein